MVPDDELLFSAQNRGFRYGDGIFETIKVCRGQVLLEHYHYDRLFLGLKLLKISAGAFSREKITAQILELCRMNNCLSLARVRLAVYRMETNDAAYVIEAAAISEDFNLLNERGWSIDIYPYVRKSTDAFSNLKTANYLPYVLADKYAKENNLDECLLVNTEGKLCDASKANIFLVLKNEVHTPALNQGCVSGTMRRFLIDEFKKSGIRVHQREISEALLLEAEEVFLSNAINGIRWVSNFRSSTYSSSFIQGFFYGTFFQVYFKD